MYFIVQWLQHDLKGRSLKFLKRVAALIFWHQLIELIGFLVAFQNLPSIQVSLWLKISANSRTVQTQ